MIWFISNILGTHEAASLLLDLCDPGYLFCSIIAMTTRVSAKQLLSWIPVAKDEYFAISVHLMCLLVFSESLPEDISVYTPCIPSQETVLMSAFCGLGGKNSKETVPCIILQTCF